MWIRLVAQRRFEGLEYKEPPEYKVYTLGPSRDWGTYRLELDEMVRTDQPTPRYAAESFHQSLVDEWR